MSRKKIIDHKQRSANKGSKGGMSTVKKTTEKAFEATKEGLGNVVDGVKKAFD